MAHIYYRLYFIFLVGLFSFSDSGHSTSDYIEIGDKVTIGQDLFEVKKKLGDGASKIIYHAVKIGCHEHCDIVIGVSIPPDRFMKRYNFALNDALNLSPSPHLRREIPMVRASIKGYRGEIYVSVMEYGPNTLHDLSKKLLPSSVRLLYEDAHQAMLAMDQAQIVNADLKPGNMVIMGPEISDEMIEQGQNYLAFSDTDVLYPSNKKVIQIDEIIMSTREFSTPEYNFAGTVINNKSAPWQVSLSFYYTLTGENLIGPDEIKDISKYFSGEMRLSINAGKLHDQMKEKAIIKLDEIMSKYQLAGNHKEVRAMKDLKELILSGLALEPNNRRFWPENIPHIKRNIIPPKNRLEIPTDLFVRKETLSNKRKLATFIGDYQNGNKSLPGCKNPTEKEIGVAEVALRELGIYFSYLKELKNYKTK